MTLLPYKIKKSGWILIAAASILTLFYFTIDLRFKIPVFALLSYFAELRVLTVFKTNFADEAILLLYISGFFFLVFTEDKNEKPHYNQCRVRAAKNAIIIYFVWMFFSTLFFYGAIFIGTLVFNLILPFVLYLVLFQIYKRRQE